MPEALVCRVDGTFQHDVQPSEISELLHQRDNVVWLDIDDPNEQDIALLRDEFGFHPLSIEDATREHQRPKIEAYGSYYFIVVYATQYGPAGKLETQPLYLFVGKNYLVSVHRGEFRQVQETIARWRAPDSPLGNTIGALLYALLDTIVDDYFPLMDQVAERVNDLEDTIFEHFERSSIQEIFSLKRDLLALRRIVAPERDVLNVLLRREMPIFKPEDTLYLQDVYDHVVRVTESVDSYRDLLSSALDSYLSVQSSRLNQILKVLTIASIVLMSNALIAGIYGMNFQVMPELGWQYGYPLALGLMAIVSISLVLVFRKLRWL